MARADIQLPVGSNAVNFTGMGTIYGIETAGGVFYLVWFDTAQDPVFSKSTDGGFTWTTPVALAAIAGIAPATWYDRWSGIAAGLIHAAYTDTTADDIFYRSIDVENSDTLGTQTTVFAGTDTAGGGALSITRARGGDLYVAGSIDAGAEDGAWASTDVGGTWGAIADPSEGATQDQYLLLPGWNADTNDVMLIFWDASADELSVKRYDKSGNSWAETSIAGTMLDAPSSATVGFPHVSAAVDITNSQNIIVAWSAVDGANADLRCWKINDTTITEVTPVVSNGTDDQGLCAVGIDTVTQDWYVFYSGKSDGSETYKTAVNLYYKVSTDDGATWGAETVLTTGVFNIGWLATIPRFTTEFLTFFQVDTATDEIRCSVLLPTAGAGGGSPVLGSFVVY